MNRAQFQKCQRQNAKSVTYQYQCKKCDLAFDVIKSVKDIYQEEYCKCGTVAERQFVPSIVYFNGTKVEHAEYNPGLGCIVRNKAHRKEICKIKGVEEIGNEKPDSLHKYYEQKREERKEQAWAEADRGWIGSEG